jgi:hypothetical protein
VGDNFKKATAMSIVLKLMKGNVADYCTKRVTVTRWKTIPVTVFLFSITLFLLGEIYRRFLFKASLPA